MRLYNTASRKIEEFKPIKPGRVSFYSCGPTVYDKPTIGNWASFIRYDILARAFRMEGYELDWTMNITDVGHLVSDEDDGEDKMEKGARRESKTAWEIADYYSDYFLKGVDYFNLSIQKQDIPRATDYIDNQIAMIKTLENKKHTYLADDGVYFDSTTFGDYGKMARLDLTGQKSGIRVARGGKKNPTDFALWKLSPKRKDGQKRDMEWNSPWGKGFPGWHIECSTIIFENLGETIDIHAGGIEHIPVHHTNEIAQSESATGKKLANFWVHNNHLQVNGKKISKSLNNGYTLEDLKGRQFRPEDFRMFVLQSNYRNESNFTWEILSEARQRRLELQAAADLRFQPEIQSPSNKVEDLASYKRKIKSAVMDNINTPEAIAVLSSLTDSLSGGLVYNRDKFFEFLKWLDDLFGLNLLKSSDISKAQKQLIEKRNGARSRKDWAESDKIRDELKTQGIALKDVGDNSSVWMRSG